jgi:hypothetical protein
MKARLRAALGCALVLAASSFAADAAAQDLAGTASAVPPFRLSYTAKPVPGYPNELTLLSVRLSGVNPVSETWVGGCDGCQGSGHLSKWRYKRGEGWVSTVRGRTILDPQSHLLVAVTSPELVGRFKIYSVRPPADLLAVKTEGCISPDEQAVAPDFPTHIAAIDQAPCSGLLLPQPGAVFQPSDAITVTFRVPERLPRGESWVLAIESNAPPAGCVKFDAQFLRDAVPVGGLLTATLLPTDSLSLPSPLTQWCSGPFDVAAFTSANHGKTVKRVSSRPADFTISSYASS